MITAFTGLYQLDWLEIISLIHLLILRILTSLELYLKHEFYSRLPGLTDVYNNGKTVLGEKRFTYHELVFELAIGLWESQNSINHKDVLGRPPCKK